MDIPWLLACPGYSPAVNTEVRVSFKLWFSLGICVGVGLLDYMVALLSVFQGTSRLF